MHVFETILIDLAIVAVGFAWPMWYAGVLAERRGRSRRLWTSLGFFLHWLAPLIVALLGQKGNGQGKDAPHTEKSAAFYAQIAEQEKARLGQIETLSQYAKAYQARA
jgi:MFS family permease